MDTNSFNSATRLSEAEIAANEAAVCALLQRLNETWGDAARASELQIRIWVDGPFRQPDQINPMVRQRAGEMNLIPVRMNTWLAADAQPLNPLDPPASSRLSAIHAPTLFMAGALDHPEVLRAADVMADAIKGAKKHIISESAHVPNMEKPEEFTQVVLSFLDGLK